MAKKHDKILQLEGKICRLGKISNNLERHGKDWETAFTVPFTGLMLTKPELNKFRRDKYCHQSWFDTSKSTMEPMAWWGDEDFKVSDDFEADELTIVVSGDRELKFESETPKDKDEEPRAACELTKLSLKPQVGGLCEMRGQLYFRPGIGKPNLLLQEHQHREVKITLVDGRVASKRERQPELPMGQLGAGDDVPAGPTSITDEPNTTTAAH